MSRTRTFGSLVVAATTLLVTPLALPSAAFAHGHGHVFVGAGFGGFYGWGPYWGWGPWWGWGFGPGPYSYGPYYGEAGSPAMGYALMSGMGAFDVNAKPNRAEVWVDGRYVADARDLDGDPSYLWLKQGRHHIVLYKAGFRSFEADVDVHVGVIRELKVKLEPGESQPPVPSAGEPRREAGEPPAAEPRPPTEPRAEAAPAEPSGSHATVDLRIQPRDATVYVDGTYRGTARELPRLRLSVGHHRIEVVRPGFQAAQREIDVSADRSQALELSRERSGGLKS